jgi:putative lipoprotein
MSQGIRAVLKVLLLVAPTIAPASEPLWRGSFVAKSAESGLFSPCRSGKRYGTHDASGEAARVYKEIASRAGRPVFMEFVGGRESEDTLRIERVVRAAASGPGCAENTAFELRAYGVAPTWRAELGGHGLLFQRAPGKPVTWPAAVWKKSAGGGVLSASGEAGHIRITIEPGRCVDTLAGAVFSLRVKIAFEGRGYEGCAYEGDDKGGQEKAPR